jgi:hypothetical protein
MKYAVRTTLAMFSGKGLPGGKRVVECISKAGCIIGMDGGRYGCCQAAHTRQFYICYLNKVSRPCGSFDRTATARDSVPPAISTPQERRIQDSIPPTITPGRLSKIDTPNALKHCSHAVLADKLSVIVLVRPRGTRWFV